MRFRVFRYTKQKDGETKNYAILSLEENDQYLEGIDIGKLSNDEILEVIYMQSHHEKNISVMQRSALEVKIEFSEMVNDPAYIEEMQTYKNKMKPYIEKAYRKFLVSNISEYANSPNHQK